VVCRKPPSIPVSIRLLFMTFVYFMNLLVLDILSGWLDGKHQQTHTNPWEVMSYVDRLKQNPFNFYSSSWKLHSEILDLV
jgi:hypothetical protein